LIRVLPGDETSN